MIPEEIVAALSEQARRHLDQAAPLPMRMMAARGLVPLPPFELAMVVCGLTFDDDANVAAAARRGLAKLPDKILSAALDGTLPPPALAALGSSLHERPVLQEKLVLNRSTPDDTIAELAAEACTEVAEIISSNQERCLRSPAIVRAIAKNPHIMRSSLDRLFDFLVRSGVVHEDMPEFAEAMSRLSPTDMLEAAEKVDLPPELACLLADDAPVAAASARRSEGYEENGEAEAAPATPEADSSVSETERVPMLKLIASLSAAKKVALALRGNREARTILIRDTNRVVAVAAVRSPRVTEQEVIAAAQSRSVCDEVIRTIANSKDLARPYTVKAALVNNPKTPLSVAMRLLTLLRQNDIRAVAKSKNVSSAIANQAKRLMAAKKVGS